MFDQTFSNLARSFSAAYGGPYADGVARWPGTPVMDDGGSIATPGAPVAKDCQVQVDVATEAMRQSPDFLEKDVRLLILGLTALDVAAMITVGSATYALRSVVRDPAAIGFECRGRLCP